MMSPRIPRQFFDLFYPDVSKYFLYDFSAASQRAPVLFFTVFKKEICPWIAEIVFGICVQRHPIFREWASSPCQQLISKFRDDEAASVFR